MHLYSSRAFQTYLERGMKHCGGLGDLSMAKQNKLPCFIDRCPPHLGTIFPLPLRFLKICLLCGVTMRTPDIFLHINWMVRRQETCTKMEIKPSFSIIQNLTSPTKCRVKIKKQNARLLFTLGKTCGQGHYQIQAKCPTRYHRNK